MPCLKLFLGSSPLKFIAINILDSLSKTTKGNQFVLSMTNRYSKTPRAVQTSRTSVTYIVNMFYEKWIAPYGICTYSLTNNGTQFVNTIFETICNFFGLGNLTTTAYQLQTSGQAERYNKTVITDLYLYVAGHQGSWDTLEHLLTCSKINQLNCSTGTTLFGLVLSKHRPVPTTVDPLSSLQADGNNATASAVLQQKPLPCIAVMRQKTDKRLTAGQRRYMDYHGRHERATATSRPGQWVYVKSPPLAVTATDRLATVLYSKLLLRKLSRYWILSSTTESGTIDEEGIPDTKSSD